MNAVSVSHVSFSYPDRDAPALCDVSFVLERGAYTALVGLNGSGKSTAARIIAGLLVPDSGTVEIADGLKTGILFQSPKDQIICGTVWRDTAFGPQNMNLPAGEVELRTIESLNITGMLDCAKRSSMALSMGQTQKVALSGMIALRPDILILDEATAMLDPASRADIFMFLEYWNRRGNTILHITHDEAAIRRAETVIAMQSGAVLWSGRSSDFFADAEIRTAVCGSPLVPEKRAAVAPAAANTAAGDCAAVKSGAAADAGETAAADSSAENAGAGENGARANDAGVAAANTAAAHSADGGADANAAETAAAAATVPNAPAESAAEFSLVFQDVSFSYGERPALRDISFALKKGTLTALTGVSGSGKSTLLELAAGLAAPDSGAVFADGRPALAQQDCDAALFEAFAADDVAFGARNRGVSGAALVRLVKDAMNAAALPFGQFADRQTFSLSGGEKKRLAVAGILALDAPIVLFDEPTAALDGPSRAAVMRMLRNLADGGKTVLFSTHRPDETAFADGVLHITAGRMDSQFPKAAAQFFGAAAEKSASGSAAPSAVCSGGGRAAAVSGTAAPQTLSAEDAARPENAAPYSDGNARPAERDAAAEPECGRRCAADFKDCRFSAAGLTEQRPLSGAKMIAFLRSTAAALNPGGERSDGLVGKLPPLLKYFLFFALFALSFSARSVGLCVLMLALSVLYALLAKFPAGKLFGAMIKIVPLLLFFCVFQMILFPAEEGERVLLPYKYFMVTPSKLLLCLRTLLHTEAALCCICAFVRSTPEYDILTGLSALLRPLSWLRIPTRYIVTITEIIFRFIPLLIDEAAAIIKTQLVRGGLGRAAGFFGKVRALLPLFVPLILQTIRRSEALADALTVRRFDTDSG